MIFFSAARASREGLGVDADWKSVHLHAAAVDLAPVTANDTARIGAHDAVLEIIGVGLSLKSGKSIKSIKPKRHRLTEARLAANRANAKKAGRPPGAMNTEKIALRDRIRLREKEIVDHMFYLAFHGESEAVQLGALHGLFDRGWGEAGATS